MTRKTLNFTDSAGIQHSVPAYRVLDITLTTDGKVSISLTGNEVFQVTAPGFADLILLCNSLPDSVQLGI